ncbi:superoxide dismutase [Halorubrum lipolyticum]|uniref:Superoxide dismutase n=1 Tax=Halorubrum lipolyticum DSM 21995 TaxID=1227482 RepID=M0NK75_9EURY|nr:superoxide dismutase [Halorubrum lipolyticum]EMA57065.1 manganese and iron superoxide dismutase [Halorubrum lipolyticum DSM 21995]
MSYELDPLPYEYDALEPHISEQVLEWHHDTMSYELDPLPYEYDALEPHISEQVLEWHHDTHHQGYVNGWNAAEETLEENRESGDFSSSGGALRNVTHNSSGHILHDLFWQNMSPEGGEEPEGRNVTHNSSGHILHDLFWQNMSPEGGEEPEGALADRIAEDFGSYEAWKGEFEAAASAASGWALLVYDTFSNQLRNVVVDKHDQGAIWGGHPILALGEFVDNFFEVVDWSEPATRYEQAVELFE